ncbi:MAG: tryptophan-rich sensory protein [Methanomicrobiales archaeon]|nr:tryptophan-rich sensory protein [Methanomicrobiales archaeon]
MLEPAWNSRQDLPKLIASILICFLAAAIGSIFTSPQIGGWYAGLEKPWFAPPNWVFGPVWTTLYLLMGIALFLVWRKGLERPDVRQGVILFGVQLAFNAAWSLIFFGLQSLFAGLVCIVILWVLILATLIQFWKIDRIAGTLLIPYIAWVSIATCLNYAIWVLNPLG